MIRRSPTIRTSMGAIAMSAVVLAVVANERWRWGYPRRADFGRENAVSWLRTVARSDFRMYDAIDVHSLMDCISREGLLVGKAKEQVIELLGVPYAWKPPSEPASVPTDFFSPWR